MKPDQTVCINTCKTLPFVEMRKASHSTACYHSHSHDEFSFGVIDKGSSTYTNLNNKISIYKGNTVTINPGDIHACNPQEDDWSYRMLFVNTQWVGQLQAEMNLSNDTMDFQPFSDSYKTNALYYQLFNQLFNCLIKDDNPLLTEIALIDYLQLLFTKKSPVTKRNHKIANPRLTGVNERLIDELDTNHSLLDLAKQSGLSRYHLIRSFKKAYGLSPHALQLDERIKKSKILLKSGQPIADVSASLGFSDQSHFQRNFKKRLALTPKQYQSFFIS